MIDTPASKPGQTEVWITGIGLATSLGEGLDAHWAALQEKRINVDEKGFAPYIVHPLMPVAFDSQIPKKGDQRQMEAWQRIGTYAAGLALDSAGIKGNKDILSKIDMVVAAGGRERDLNVDSGVLTAEAKGANAPGFLNERLMSDLRPTLFWPSSPTCSRATSPSCTAWVALRAPSWAKRSPAPMPPALRLRASPRARAISR